MFHLMTHAFFKALLFLGAGSVIHAMSDEQDMRKMGGIWKKIPVTYGLMWIGSLALAGIPPFAGYYSKDIVLEAAWADHTWFGELAYWLGIAAAFMTAFYSWRLLIMTFHGKPRATQKVMNHVHESPPVMIGPLLVLATGALLAGAVFYNPFVGGGHGDGHGDSHAVVEAHYEDSAEAGHGEAASHDGASQEVLADHAAEDDGHDGDMAHAESNWNYEAFWDESLVVLPENNTVEAAHNVPFWVKKMPLLVGALGILLAYVFYLWVPSLPSRMIAIFKLPYVLFSNKWFFDEMYNAAFVKNSKRLGAVFWKTDREIVDRYGPDGSAGASNWFAAIISKFQSGYIYQYAFVMMIAVVALVSWLAVRIFKGI
jgi:NADH-quinone oxidoreductase subunit L